MSAAQDVLPHHGEFLHSSTPEDRAAKPIYEAPVRGGERGLHGGACHDLVRAVCSQ
jgi:hypothetical protein